MVVLLLLLVKRLDVVGLFAAEIECGRKGTDARFVLGKGEDCSSTAAASGSGNTGQVAREGGRTCREA